MLDAMDFGVPSRRPGTFLIAHNTRPVHIPRPPAGTVRTGAAAALGGGSGEQVRTRANRKPGGGNLFAADKPSWCLTEKARTWTREFDGARLTSSEAGVLDGFPAAFPCRAAVHASSCRRPMLLPPSGSGATGRGRCLSPYEDLRGTV